MIRRTGAARGAALVVALAIAAGCSDESGADPDETAATTTTVVEQVHASDGRLTIGVMLPPAATLLHDPISNGVQSAIEQINLAGGVFGRRVELVMADEGDTAASGSDAVQALLDANVDAIVGPASSIVALNTLQAVVSNGVLACSPTAAALALDDFPDDGLFFRTVPSDSMQAKAIVQAAESTGVLSVAIAYVDDAYGRPLSAAVTDALASFPIEIVESVPFSSGDDELDAEVDRIVASGARVVILLAGSNDGTQFLEALSEVEGSMFDGIIVNDALRAPESAQRIAGLPARIRGNILGVAPQAQSDDPERPFDPGGPFATQAFDCVNLITLAAGVADSDVGAQIAARLPSVSSGGSGCRTFADCSGKLASGLEVDYDGPSGLTEIGSNGDPRSANFDLFEFGDDGRDVPEGLLSVDS